MLLQLQVGQGLLIIEVYNLHSDTPHPVGLLGTSDKTDAKATTWKQASPTINRCRCVGGIRNRNQSKRAAADLRLSPRDLLARSAYVHLTSAKL